MRLYLAMRRIRLSVDDTHLDITQIWEGTNQVHRQLIGRSFIEK